MKQRHGTGVDNCVLLWGWVGPFGSDSGQEALTAQ